MRKVEAYFLVSEDTMELVEELYCWTRRFYIPSAIFLHRTHFKLGLKGGREVVVLLLLVSIFTLGVFYSQLLVGHNIMLNVIYSGEKETSTDSIRQANWMKILFANCIIKVQESNDLQMIEM